MKEKIVIVGFGRIGQANALALNIMGYTVYYYDIAEPPRYYVNGHERDYDRIIGISNIRVRAQDGNNTFYIVCVSDVVADDGDQDITEIEAVLRDLHGAMGRVILRSTILPERLNGLPFHYYVPEFLREKYAVEECLNPSWLVIGMNCSGKLPTFLEIWRDRSSKVFIGSPDEAALIKYLSNIWNAIRIAFVNEFGSAIGARPVTDNLEQINRVVDFVFDHGLYCKYGMAYSGRCLPKDMRAFLKRCEDAGFAMPILSGVHEANVHHANRPGQALPARWPSE